MGRVPIFGICLGHQLVGLALGGKTYKLKFGHHGGNHPVKQLLTGKVEITAHNHNFAVDPDSLPMSEVELTHVDLNDNTLEGLRHRNLPLFSVQYHPEASPGPHDSHYLFNDFVTMMEEWKGSEHRMIRRDRSDLEMVILEWSAASVHLKSRLRHPEACARGRFRSASEGPAINAGVNGISRCTSWPASARPAIHRA